MEEVQEQMTAKRILYRKKDSSWFGSDYNVNLYQGCPHGCIYCDSRSECYAVEHFSQVRAKRDALDLLQKQLASCGRGSRSSQLPKSRIKTNSFVFLGSKTGRTHPMRPPCFFQDR